MPKQLTLNALQVRSIQNSADGLHVMVTYSVGTVDSGGNYTPVTTNIRTFTLGTRGMLGALPAIQPTLLQTEGLDLTQGDTLL